MKGSLLEIRGTSSAPPPPSYRKQAKNIVTVTVHATWTDRELGCHLATVKLNCQADVPIYAYFDNLFGLSHKPHAPLPFVLPPPGPTITES
ncbi:unnamed protein product [Protopolystoma xenopodis]|uniref:Uncharacterized protein n=1 Tax=Protopolystoma xenopodis TaxID=117903 RepID=A0A3S5B0G0_9PLAT|nr:unnamed protein product [Protopolystoma xenopodis]